MDKKLLGRRINAARKDRGWTSEHLSEICNINATYLRQIESGAKTPSLQMFVSLCEGFSDVPACGQSADCSISGLGRAAYALPHGNADTAQHDNRYDPKRDGSNIGLNVRIFSH